MVLICFFFSIIYHWICRPDLCNKNAFRVPPTDLFNIVLYRCTSRLSSLKLFHAVPFNQQASKRIWASSHFYCCNLILSSVQPAKIKTQKAQKNRKHCEQSPFSPFTHFFLRWNGLSNIPEKPDEEWKSLVEEFCVLSTQLKTARTHTAVGVGAKSYSLGQLHNKTAKC